MGESKEEVTAEDICGIILAMGIPVIWIVGGIMESLVGTLVVGAIGVLVAIIGLWSAWRRKPDTSIESRDTYLAFWWGKK